MAIFEHFKRKAKAPPRHSNNEPSRDTMRIRQREAFANYAFYPEGARYQVTTEPVFNAQRSILESTGEQHAFTYANYKLCAMFSNGELMRDLYVWDMAAPSGTLNPIAQFHYNEATHEVERT